MGHGDCVDYRRLRLERAPLALAPAVRLVEPLLRERAPSQQPLLPLVRPAGRPDPQQPIPDDVRLIVGGLTTAVVEVLRGSRPLGQLSGHTGADVQRLLVQLRRSPSPTLRLASLRLSQPNPDVIEAAARLALGTRSRAAALCFARCRDGWRLRALQLALDPGVIRAAG